MCVSETLSLKLGCRISLHWWPRLLSLCVFCVVCVCVCVCMCVCVCVVCPCLVGITASLWEGFPDAQGHCWGWGSSWDPQQHCCPSLQVWGLWEGQGECGLKVWWVWSWRYGGVSWRYGGVLKVWWCLEGMMGVVIMSGGCGLKVWWVWLEGMMGVAWRNGGYGLTLLRASQLNIMPGIAHALLRCKKCSSYKQLRKCDKEKGFSS